MFVVLFYGFTGDSTWFPATVGHVLPAIAANKDIGKGQIGI